jgi:HK97 gp10 family phage protein
MEVKIEGLRGLHADFDKVKRKVGKAGDAALQSVGLEIVAEAKENLKRNRTTNTGVLSASGKVQKDKDGGIDAGFFSREGEQGYAAAVEYGRGPTKKASPDGITLQTNLKAWVHRKLGIAYGKELDGAAFLIARKIHRKGTKAQPFFVPAVKKFEDKIRGIVDNIIKKEIR